MRDIRNYDLTGHNTFGIKASCARFVEFESVGELKEAAAGLTGGECPLLILGGGSNLLLTGDYPGTVLHSAIKGVSVSEDGDRVYLRAGSGETWDDVVSMCVENGWHGLENLSLIPGEVGASAVQNIGAYGAEAKDFIYKVEAVELATGRECSFCNAECEYSYRQSRFKREWRDRYVITHVTYCLSKVFRPRVDYGNIRAELERRGITELTAGCLRDVIIDIRRSKLPDTSVEGNAGSFFMNPVVTREKYEQLASEYAGMPHYPVDESHEKIPAGWMIEQCGWKGKSLGRAGVHSKQALVLVNRGGATGAEVLALCEAVRRDVRDKFGVEINPEVNIR